MRTAGGSRSGASPGQPQTAHLVDLAEQLVEVVPEVLDEQDHVESFRPVEKGHRRNDHRLTQPGLPNVRRDASRDLAIPDVAARSRDPEGIRDARSAEVEHRDRPEAHPHDPPLIGRSAGLPMTGVLGDRDGGIRGEEHRAGTRCPPAVTAIVGPAEDREVERLVGWGVAEDRTAPRLDAILELLRKARDVGGPGPWTGSASRRLLLGVHCGRRCGESRR